MFRTWWSVWRLWLPNAAFFHVDNLTYKPRSPLSHCKRSFIVTDIIFHHFLFHTDLQLSLIHCWKVKQMAVMPRCLWASSALLFLLIAYFPFSCQTELSYNSFLMWHHLLIFLKYNFQVLLGDLMGFILRLPFNLLISCCFRSFFLFF